jgi:ribosome biogenesis GTPase A
VRISDQIELLDAPGVIPSQIKNEEKALKLAICEDIGEAAYENQEVAAALVEFLLDLGLEKKLGDRYKFAVDDMTGVLYLEQLAAHSYQNDIERTARHILNDFRKGLLGALPLELPPD